MLGIFNLKKDTYNKKNKLQRTKDYMSHQEKTFLKNVWKDHQNQLPMYLKVPSHLVLRPSMVGVLTPN